MTFARTVRLLATFVIVAGVCALPLSLRAQSPGQARQYDPAYDGAPLPATLDDGDWGDIPAYVSAVTGDARLERDGQASGDFEQVPLQIGDQIRTTRGRVEILYDDGSVVALDEYSAVSVDADSSWRLLTGRIKVVSRSGDFSVDAGPAGVARLRNAGDYRVTLAVNRRNEPEVELAVTRGSAELENQLGRTLVRAGTRALTTASFAPSVPYAFADPRDEFERWTESLEADRYGVTSARYLPAELRAYGGDFDRYGSWSRHSSYGWVWYPRVAVGWEPFRSGRWSFVAGFGYNWIGGSRWEWPTYYCGRWDRYGSNWFWVPSRPTYYRRVGYSAPRTSVSVHVNYYSRPRPTRPLPSYRGDTNQRSRIITVPRTDDRQATRSALPPTRDRVAVPRSPAVTSGVWPRPSATPPDSSSRSPMSRRTDDRVFGSRPSPERVPDEGGRMSRPAREPQRPAPSVEGPRPSRTEPRPSNEGGVNVGRMPSPGRVGAPPAGSRTPSPSSSSRSSGTAVRRGGGR